MPLPPIENVLKGKPTPELLLTAARKLGVVPTACVVYQDRPVGAAAHAAGMCPINVREQLTNWEHPGQV